jgi:DNA primase
MGRPYIDFAAVKAAVTMTQVLERYGLMPSMTAKKGGETLEGPCPIHKGTDPSQFKVSIPKNCWNCFSECKCGGNVLDFVGKMENVEAHEAAHLLNGWFGLGLDGQPAPPREKPPAPVARSQRTEARPETPKAAEPEREDKGPNAPLRFALKDLQTDHPYFQNRGLLPETVAEFGLGHCRRGTMAGRIVIPIHNSGGELVGYAGRWPGEEPPDGRPRYKLPEGFRKSSEVFGLHRALREEGGSPLVVVEGFFDAMRLWQLGFRRTVSLMGSFLSAAQESLLTEHGGKGGIVLLFDEDDAGRTGRANALQWLAMNTFVRVVPLPREGAQPDHLTEEELRALLA